VITWSYLYEHAIISFSSLRRITLTRSLTISQHKISKYMQICIRSPWMRDQSAVTARPRWKIWRYALEHSGIWTHNEALKRSKTLRGDWLFLCIRSGSVVRVSDWAIRDCDIKCRFRLLSGLYNVEINEIYAIQNLRSAERIGSSYY
jgi:hypothetical protein